MILVPLNPFVRYRRRGLGCALVALLAIQPALAPAQDASVKVVTTTITRNGAHKECMSLSRTQGLHYWFRAEAPLDFNVQYSEAGSVVYPVRREKLAMASGTYYAKLAEVHCMVLTNQSSRPVTVRIEFARVER